LKFEKSFENKNSFYRIYLYSVRNWIEHIFDMICRYEVITNSFFYSEFYYKKFF
jgi:hypothetical protein